MSGEATERLSAERAVLGASLLSRDALVEAHALLVPDDFEVSQHRAVFRTMVDLCSAGKPVDPVTLEDALTQTGDWRGLSALADGEHPSRWLMRLMGEWTPAAANMRHYAEIVARHAALRRLRHVCASLGEMAEKNPEEAQRLLLEGQKLLTESVKGRMRPGVDLADIVPKVMAEFEQREAARRTGGGPLRGIDTGLTELNYLTGGLQNGQLCVLAARTSIGKTAYASQIALLNAVFNACPALIFSLEMGPMELGERFFSRLARVDSTKLRSGDLNRDDWREIYAAGGRMEQRGLVTISNTRSLAGIGMEMRAFRVGHRDQQALVVVDYMQLVRVQGRTREEEIAEVTGTLKALAMELELPVLGLGQLNRGPEIEEREPRVSDLRGSGAIEQDADVILIITRTPGDTTGHCVVRALKVRNGNVGDVHAVWHGANYELIDPQASFGAH